jgi:pimeloyl-ACP methyl ester carboxylesterase
MGCTGELWSLLDCPADVPVLMPLLAEADLDEQVDRLLDELPPRFALAGLSLGAVVAMALVRRAPERVARLAVLSTNPHAPTPVQLEEWARLRARLTSIPAREVQESLLPMLLSPAVIASRPDLVALTLAMADELGEATFDHQLQLQASRVDERPGLRDVRCPTLVLAAEHDRLCPVRRHQEIASLVPGSRLAQIPHCAHLSPLEQPQLVSNHLVRWLATVSV